MVASPQNDRVGGHTEGMRDRSDEVYGSFGEWIASRAALTLEDVADGDGREVRAAATGRRQLHRETDDRWCIAQHVLDAANRVEYWHVA